MICTGCGGGDTQVQPLERMPSQRKVQKGPCACKWNKCESVQSKRSLFLDLEPMASVMYMT